MPKTSGIDINQQTDIIRFQRLNYACPVVSITIIIYIGICKLKNSFVVIPVRVKICRQMRLELVIVINIWHQAIIGRYYHRFSGINLLSFFEFFVLFYP